MDIKVWEVKHIIISTSIFEEKDERIVNFIKENCALDENGDISYSDANSELLSAFFKELLLKDPKHIITEEDAMDIGIETFAIHRKDANGDDIPDSIVEEAEKSKFFQEFINSSNKEN